MHVIFTFQIIEIPYDFVVFLWKAVMIHSLKRISHCNPKLRSIDNSVLSSIPKLELHFAAQLACPSQLTFALAWAALPAAAVRRAESVVL